MESFETHGINNSFDTERKNQIYMFLQKWSSQSCFVLSNFDFEQPDFDKLYKLKKCQQAY